MEEIGNEPATAVVDGTGSVYQWWATASAVQLGWGIYSYRKGCAGDCRLMPVKAFAVASLFVGAGTTSAVAILTAYGIHSVLSLKIFCPAECCF